MHTHASALLRHIFLPAVDELEKKEEEDFRTGPLSVLTTSVKTNSQVGMLGAVAERSPCTDHASACCPDV